MEMTAALLAYESEEGKRKDEQKKNFRIIPFPSRQERQCPEGMMAEETEPIIPDIIKIKEEKNSVEDNIREMHEFRFTEKELNEMPDVIRKHFRINGYTVGVRKKPNGVIELRVQIQRIPLSASSKNEKIARKKLLEKIKQLPTDLFKEYSYREKKKTEEPNIPTIKEFSVFWLEEIKKPEIKEGSLLDLTLNFKKHIYPYIGDIRLNKLKDTDILDVIHRLGQSRTAEKVYTNLKCLFKIAVAKGYMKENPLSYIKPPVYEAEKGCPFTLEEEARFVKKCIKRGDIGYALILQLYIGARRSELKSAVIDGDFIRIENAKQRKGKKVTTRKIPISPMLRPHLPKINFEFIHTLSDDKLSRIVPTFTEGKHHNHELRHTFSNRCQTCRVEDKVVSFWMNHSYGDTMTLKTYTNLPDEYFIEEAKKIKYNLPPITD